MLQVSLCSLSSKVSYRKEDLYWDEGQNIKSLFLLASLTPKFFLKSEANYSCPSMVLQEHVWIFLDFIKSFEVQQGSVKVIFAKILFLVVIVKISRLYDIFFLSDFYDSDWSF